MKNVECEHPGCTGKTRTAYGPDEDPMYLCSVHGRTARRSLDLRRNRREKMHDDGEPIMSRRAAFNEGHGADAKILPFRRPQAQPSAR